ncbi:hypothetical protein QA640_47770 (plasmid) [Bradyrhizobium sp. CB82]|uniref:hypothetical protein n=1 Tax=Bradyrhizobium sp. CB82 TaxID=3039159 RepID=UPI0024B05D93|nr:hypothetical protein [Bradyrhizobium sp. CB82]WFU45683.1 hypothetical protein QA640_47770 [Bradyrhizobium sp. CB82]
MREVIAASYASDEGWDNFELESKVKEVASLGTVAIVALLFLAFLTTLRPIAIVAAQGETVIDVRANEAATLAHSEDPSRTGTPSKTPVLTGQPR